MDILEKLSNKINEEKEVIEEGIFGDFGKFVMDVNKLGTITNDLNKFVKVEAAKVKKKKGKISKDEYGEEMKKVIHKVLTKIETSDIPFNMKPTLTKNMGKQFGELFKGLT